MGRLFNTDKKYLWMLVIGLALFTGGIFFTIEFKYPPGWDFRNNLYLPTFLLVRGQSPYNIHVLVDGSTAVWMPMTLGFFFPLGWMNLQQASNLWWLVSLVALFCVVWLSTGQQRPPLGKLVFSIFFIFLFPSTAAHLGLGQISILICLALLIIARFDRNLPIWVVALLLIFSLAKPQLSSFFIPAYVYFIWRKYGWQNMLRLGKWMLIWLVISLLPITVAYPNWWGDFYLNLANNLSWSHPTFYNYFAPFLGSLRELLSIIVFITGFGVSIWLAEMNITLEENVFHTDDSQHKNFLLWVLALTPLFSIYIWSWDFVMLYPLIVSAIFQLRNKSKEMIIFAGFVAVFIFYTYQILTGQVNDVYHWWVPPVTIILILIAQKGIETENIE